MLLLLKSDLFIKSFISEVNLVMSCHLMTMMMMTEMVMEN